MNAAPQAAPSTNGASSAVTGSSTPPAPTKDTATGTQKPAGGSSSVSRGPDGKFQSSTAAPAEGEQTQTKPPDDDPEIDFDGVKLKKSQAKRELERAKNSARILTEAEKRLKQAEALEKAEAERKSKYKSDAKAFFAETGMTPEEAKEWAANYLYQHEILPGQMTPEQRELNELKAKLAERDAKDKADAEKAETEKKKAINQEESKKLHAQIIAAAEAGKIPNTRRAIERIIDKSIRFDSRGMELPLEDIAAIVRGDLVEDVTEVIDAMSLDEQREALGPERWAKQEKAWLAYFQSKLKPSTAPVPVRAPAQARSSSAKRETITPQEFMARLNGRK